MKFFLVSIWDKKAEVYRFPHFVRSIGEETRNLQSVVNSVEGKRNELSDYSEDFTLYMHGEFDDVSGEMLTLKKPNFVVQLVSLKRDVEGILPGTLGKFEEKVENMVSEPVDEKKIEYLEDGKKYPEKMYN